jgi:hypothetical protein
MNETDSLFTAALLDTVQKQTFEYFWSGAEPVSGLARERIHLDGVYPSHDQDIITIGGSGFGLMAILVGVERGFISREQALARYEKAIDFLAKADRFHGAWPHWLDPSGKVSPFSKKDDGGDLVETAFLIQGLLTVQQYFKDGNKREQELAGKIQQLWEEVEWDWYTKGGENVLYWHWSPKYGWEMDFPVGGYNECLIMYVLAAASPTHPISKDVYEQGWARAGAIANDTTFYGFQTVLDHYEHDDTPVGPLFWAHYSYLGLNPKDLADQYADYWKLNRNHALIHHAHNTENPNGYEGYGPDCWGLLRVTPWKGMQGITLQETWGLSRPQLLCQVCPIRPGKAWHFWSIYIRNMTP